MTSRLHHHLAALLMLGPVAAGTLFALPVAAIAQPALELRGLEIRGLEVRADEGMRPGARLRFRLEGTPGAQASVSVRGVRDAIALREVERGMYAGRYVVVRGDRIEPGTPVRATLQRGNRTAVAEYSLPGGNSYGNSYGNNYGNSYGRNEAPRAVPPPAPPPQALPQPLPPPSVTAAPPVAGEVRILRVQSWPADRPDPGAVVRFSVEGTPGSQVWVQVPGVQAQIRLEEGSPGFYQGGYTLTPADRVPARAAAVAYMRQNDRISTMQFPEPVVARR